MDLVATLEPGSKTDLIVVKDCKTRFGQPLTTGMAFIYADEESMKVELNPTHYTTSETAKAMAISCS